MPWEVWFLEFHSSNVKESLLNFLSSGKWVFTDGWENKWGTPLKDKVVLSSPKAPSWFWSSGHTLMSFYFTALYYILLLGFYLSFCKINYYRSWDYITVLLMYAHISAIALRRVHGQQKVLYIVAFQTTHLNIWGDIFSQRHF